MTKVFIPDLNMFKIAQNVLYMGLSRRKCPVFQKTKLRILIIIWIVIEILTLNFMLLTRKLAASVKYIVFGSLFYNGERKKN